MIMKEPCSPNKAEDRQSPFRWTFVRRGGFDQVEITSGTALLALDQLDQKLWTALSCPTHGLEFDEDTLRLIDSDGDGRIRVPELIAAIKWAGKLLKKSDDLLKGSSFLSLDAIDDSCEQGAQILKSARRILINLGKPDATAITVEDTANRSQIFANTPFNGDGIICPESAEDEETAQAIRDVMEGMGSEMDRSGRAGIGEQHVSAFFAEAEAYLNWWTGAQESLAPMFPSGKAMDDLAGIFGAVRPKIEDYFVRCHLACYDDRALEHLNPSVSEYQSLTARTLSVALEEVAALPLARIAPDASLPLSDGVNPAWASALEKFRSTIVEPLLGDKTHLSYEDWKNLCARFDALDAWLAAKKGAVVERLGVNRLQELLSGPTRQRVFDLLERDRALQAEAEAIDQVDRLVRFHRDLFQLVRNFVSFSDFYSPKAQAVFQAGTLYLDQRSCSLCLRVDNIDAHSALASLGRTFLAYCTCKRRGGSDVMNIAAAFTDGDADNLRVGRNGIFYDRQGRDWDATIVKIVEHPISIRQAFWAPYKRFARMVAEQIEKFAASKEKHADSKLSTAAATVTPQAAAPAPPAAAPPFDIGKFAGIFAAIGLAVGAFGTALASFMTGLMTLRWWQIPLALAGLVLVISGPSMIIAWLKLRQRNLGPILDACGWAVNTRAKLNIPFGKTLTGMARLPEGAQRTMEDPYAEKIKPWKLWLILAALLAAAVILWSRGTFAPKPSGEKAQPAITAPAEQPKASAPTPSVSPSTPPSSPAAPAKDP